MEILPLYTYAFLCFPLPISYDHAFDVISSSHIHCRFDLVEDFFFSLEIMASRMATSYGPQVAQANEEPALKSSLDLTLTQHPHDEELES